MENDRRRRVTQPLLAAPLVLSVVLGSAAPGWGQAGRLTQLGRPDACTTAAGDGVNCRAGVGLDGAYDVEVSPDGQNVYVPSYEASSVAVFARDPATGALTQLPAPFGCIAESGDGTTCIDGVALDGPQELAISKNGKHVYVASADSDAIAVFRRDFATGALAQVAAPGGCIAENGDGVTCTDATGLDGASAVVIGRNGKHVYAASNTSDAVTAFVRDPMSGALTQLPAPGGCFRQNGDGITCTAAEGLNGATGLVATRNGRHLYVASTLSDAVTVLRRNKTTGELSLLAKPLGCYRQGGDGAVCTDGLALNGVGAVAVTRSGKNVYAVSFQGDSVAAFLREQ